MNAILQQEIALDVDLLAERRAALRGDLAFKKANPEAITPFMERYIAQQVAQIAMIRSRIRRNRLALLGVVGGQEAA